MIKWRLEENEDGMRVFLCGGLDIAASHKPDYAELMLAALRLAEAYHVVECIPESASGCEADHRQEQALYKTYRTAREAIL